MPTLLPYTPITSLDYRFDNVLPYVMDGFDELEVTEEGFAFQWMNTTNAFIDLPLQSLTHLTVDIDIFSEITPGLVDSLRIFAGDRELEVMEPLPKTIAAADVLERIRCAIQRMHEGACGPLLGIGVGAPGFVDPSRGVVVYCHHGVRSLRATHFLRSIGVATAFSMHGGIEAWAERSDPEMPPY